MVRKVPFAILKFDVNEENSAFQKTRGIFFTENGEIIIDDIVKEHSLLKIFPRLNKLILMISHHRNELKYLIFNSMENEYYPNLFYQQKLEIVYSPNLRGISFSHYNWLEFLEIYNKVMSSNISWRDTINQIIIKTEEIRWRDRISKYGYIIGKNTFSIGSNKFLNNRFEMFDPRLTFILTKDQLLKDNWLDGSFLKDKMSIFFDGDVYYINGDYFGSKKGGNCFDISSKYPKHILIKIDWGGFESSTKGFLNIYKNNNDIKNNILYYYRASSNRNFKGSDYIIFPINFKR